MTRRKLYGPLTLIFLAGNFIYGLGFTAFSWSTGVTSSSLFQSLHETYQWLPHIWGLVLMLAVALVVLALYRRRWYTNTLGAAMGFGSWVFSSLVYLQTGYVLVFFTVGLLYLSFWVYYYFMFVSSLNNE